MMKRLAAFILLGVLLTGCTEQPGSTSQHTAPPNQNLTQELAEELEQARQVALELDIPELDAFEEAAESLRDQGLEFLSFGMPRQASFCFSVAGANVSALRLAAQQIAGQPATGFADWDTVGAINHTSPVPFLCEAIAAEHTGDSQRAQTCRELAAMNQNTVDFAEGLGSIAKLSKAQLAEMIEDLVAFEQHLYWFYPADPIARERNGMEWSVEYHLSLGAAMQALGFAEKAVPHYLDALAQNPFDPELFLLCAKVMYTAGDINLMYTYLEEGLLLEPSHPGLNVWSALFWLAAGDATLAQAHLDAVPAGELTEEDAAVYRAVEKAMKEG